MKATFEKKNDDRGSIFFFAVFNIRTQMQLRVYQCGSETIAYVISTSPITFNDDS